MIHTRSTSWRWALLVVPLIALAVGLVWLEPGPTSAANSCAPSRPHASGDFAETIVSDGLTREYILHVPPSYIADERMPLVLNWHGLGSSAGQQADYSELPAKADAEGFIVVMPQGLGDPARHNFTKSAAGADDVAFTTDMLDKFEAELCIDPARVFSTGISNGAQMSVRLACNLSDRIAAIAPVAGAYYPPFVVGFAEPGCLSTRPVALLAFHGTDDTTIPFEGGAGIFGVIFRSLEGEIMPEWAAHNGCTVGPSDTSAAPGVRLRNYSACDDGVAVQLYVVEDADGAGADTKGGGHTWPGAVDTPSLGNTTQEISATDLMWDFFQAHPLATVGGIAELPEVAGAPLETVGSSGPSAGLLAGVAVAVTAASSSLGGAAWYARRRLR